MTMSLKHHQSFAVLAHVLLFLPCIRPQVVSAIEHCCSSWDRDSEHKFTFSNGDKYFQKPYSGIWGPWSIHFGLQKCGCTGTNASSDVLSLTTGTIVQLDLFCQTSFCFPPFTFCLPFPHCYFLNLFCNIHSWLLFRRWLFLNDGSCMLNKKMPGGTDSFSLNQLSKTCPHRSVMQLGFDNLINVSLYVAYGAPLSIMVDNFWLALLFVSSKGQYISYAFRMLDIVPIFYVVLIWIFV